MHGALPTLTIAFDKSMRSTDADGRLHIAKSHISKACVNPYMGKEIPGWESLGLVPDKIYKLLRDPVELEKGAATFARLPILKEHVPVTVDAPQPDLVIGAIGSDVSFEAPYLDADLCFWDAPSIAGIDSGKLKELSCAYRYVPLMQSGEFNGEAYDGVMTEIKGNHLALVEKGRAGPDVVAADSDPFSPKENTMKMTKTGKALFVALSAMSPVLAADAAFTPELFKSVTKKNFKRDEVKAKLLALDANIDSTKLDAVLDAIIDTEESPKPTEPAAADPASKPAKDASPADKVREMLAGKVDDATMDAICNMMAKPAGDAENPEDNDEEEEPTDTTKPVAAKDVKAAMDSFGAKLRADLKAAETARRDVRSVVGDLDVAMDSAAEIYGFALDHLKIDHAQIKDTTALRMLFKVASERSAPSAPADVIAQDSAGLEKRFPGLSRIRHA